MPFFVSVLAHILIIIWHHICTWLYLVLSSHMGGVGFICILSGTNFRTHWIWSSLDRNLMSWLVNFRKLSLFKSEMKFDESKATNVNLNSYGVFFVFCDSRLLKMPKSLSAPLWGPQHIFAKWIYNVINGLTVFDLKI